MQISSEEAPRQSTYASPTVAMAPKFTGTSTQINWLIVKVQTPSFFPAHGFSTDEITGAPQQVVLVAPAFANGVTVTGTHRLFDTR